MEQKGTVDNKTEKSKKKYAKVLIRRALIRDPNISSRALAKVLKCGHKTAWKYMVEVKKENTIRLEKDIERLRTTSVEQELGKMETEINEVIRELWTITSSQNIKYADRVSALRALVSTRKDLFGLKFDNVMDWNFIKERMGIKSVAALDSKKGYERKGIGRVLNGKRLIDLLKNDS